MGFVSASGTDFAGQGLRIIRLDRTPFIGASSKRNQLLCKALADPQSLHIASILRPSSSCIFRPVDHRRSNRLTLSWSSLRATGIKSMRVLSFTMASLLAASIATPSLAQESGSAFTGFYGGVEVGAARQSTKTTVTPPTGLGAAATKTKQRTGLDFGGFAGYGYTFDNGLYLGVEGSINQASGKSKPLTLAGVSTLEKAGLEAALTGRVGYTVTEDILVYGIAGVNRRQSTFNLADGLKKKQTLSGSVFGVGAAYAFGDNLIGRVEVERSNFGKKSFINAALPTVRYNPSATRVSVGLAYKF